MSKEAAPRAATALAAIFCSGLTAMLVWLEPIPQDPAFHDFVDQRTALAVPNFLNVVSNVPFLMIGAFALTFLMRQKERLELLEPMEWWMFAVLFFGGLLTGVGSSYYHAWPDNETLLWDRLPLTLVFTSFFAAVITDRLGALSGRRAFLPLVVFGVGSVVYWHLEDDLRFYAFIQFFPMLMIPLMGLFLRARYSRGSDLFWIIGWYAVAKAAELLDAAIYSMGGIVSGHTIKHLLAAVALAWIFLWLRKRNLLKEA